MFYAVFFLTMLAVAAIALWLRPMVGEADAEPVDIPLSNPDYGVQFAYCPSLFSTKRFLFSYVWSIYIRFTRIKSALRIQSQIKLMNIRQVISLMKFGRGILHS